MERALYAGNGRMGRYLHDGSDDRQPDPFLLGQYQSFFQRPKIIKFFLAMQLCFFLYVGIQKDIYQKESIREQAKIETLLSLPVSALTQIQVAQE